MKRTYKVVQFLRITTEVIVEVEIDESTIDLAFGTIEEYFLERAIDKGSEEIKRRLPKRLITDKENLDGYAIEIEMQENNGRKTAKSGKRNV